MSVYLHDRIKPAMDSSTLSLFLTPQLFAGPETVLAEAGPLSASAFRFAGGVCGLRLANELGQLVLLPFQGQQIWSAVFGGRDLTMHSMFTEPRPTRDYLKTYGGFLLHCGATAIGSPTAADSHPLHGELPNAPYGEAFLVLGSDSRGSYVGLGGRCRHTVAFSSDYAAEPLVKLYAGSSLFRVSMTITNLKRSPMELMYMAHINFRPVDFGRLVYSAPATPEHVRVRTSIPAHIQPGPGYAKFLAELARQPEQHHLLAPELRFDPQVIFFIDYRADKTGWAHSLQIHPDGSADYVGHRPAQLNHAARWICRTADQDALGLVLPATAGLEGYTVEKAKGNVKTLSPREQFFCELEIGRLDPVETRAMEAKITGLTPTFQEAPR